MDTESYSTQSKFSISYSMTKTPITSAISGSFQSKASPYTSPSPSKLGFEEDSDHSEDIADILDIMPPKKSSTDRKRKESDDDSKAGRTTRQSAQLEEAKNITSTDDDNERTGREQFEPLTSVQEDHINDYYDEEGLRGEVDYEPDEDEDGRTGGIVRSVEQLEYELGEMRASFEEQLSVYDKASSELQKKVSMLEQEILKKDNIIANLRKEIISKDRVIKSLSSQKLNVPSAHSRDIKGPKSIPLSIVSTKETMQVNESQQAITLEDRDTRILLQLAIQRGLEMKPSYKKYLTKTAPKDLDKFREQLCSFIRSHEKPKRTLSLATPRKILLKKYNSPDQESTEHNDRNSNKRERSDDQGQEDVEEDENDKKPAAKRGKHGDE